MMDDDPLCAVCLEEEGELVQLNGCTHKFHFACIEQVFRRGRGECPLCRCNPFDRLNASLVDVDATDASEAVDFDVICRIRACNYTCAKRELRRKQSTFARRLNRIATRVCAIRQERQVLNNEHRDFKRSNTYRSGMTRLKALKRETAQLTSELNSHDRSYHSHKHRINRKLLMAENSMVLMGGTIAKAFSYEASGEWMRQQGTADLMALYRAGRIDDDTLIDHDVFDRPFRFETLKFYIENKLL